MAPLSAQGWWQAHQYLHPHLGAGTKAWLLIWWPCSPVPVTVQTLTGVSSQGTNAARSGSAEGWVLQAMPRSSFSSPSTWRPNTALESKATQKMTSPLVRKQLCRVFTMLNLCNPHHPNFWASAHHGSYKSICTVFWFCIWFVFWLAEHLHTKSAVLSEILEWLFKHFMLIV